MPPLWNQRMPPAKIAFQSKSPGFSKRRRFVGPVVENNRRANAVSAVAVDGGHVGAVDAVVFETLVKRLHSHRLDAFGDQIADRILHHGGGNRRCSSRNNRRDSPQR